MEPTSTASISPVRLARWLLAALFAVSVYRAATQPVTGGEAWNYDRFIGPSWTESFSRFDTNNHVLNTLLARISTTGFHLTELSLRLPSLLFGALYLWVVFRLARRWFGQGLSFLAVVALLTLNPLIVDALSEARGYGMALACWLWAVELILESAQSFSAPKLNLAAICLGLSVAASLAFLAPAIALLLVGLVWLRGEPDALAQGRAMALLFLVAAFALLVIPLNRAEWTTLAVGAGSLRQSVNEIIALSFGISDKGIGSAGVIALALLTLAGAAAAVRYRRCPEGALAALAGATLLLTVALLLAGRRYLHTPHPQEGAIYMIPITVLLVASLFLKRNNKTVQIAFIAGSLVLTARYVTEFPFGMYPAGSRFSGARTLAKELRAAVGRGHVRIGASLAAEPIVNYYRARYHQENWQRVERTPLTGTYDYYVLTPDDAPLIGQRHLHVIYRDAGLTLAR